MNSRIPPAGFACRLSHFFAPRPAAVWSPNCPIWPLTRTAWLASLVFALALFISRGAQARLISGDFDTTVTQTGAAALGSSGDHWNALSGTTGTLVDSTGTAVSGVGLTLSSQGVYTDAGGAVMDAVTTPLMESYAFGYTAPSTVTLSITGLTAYTNQAFTLVVYAAGDTSGQGATLSVTGATGGNSGSTLSTTAASRQISAGNGVAYQTFTGILTNGTLTLTATENTGQSFVVVNGFQLQVGSQTNPVIVSEPVSQFAYPGDTVSFSVAAAGTTPFSYQWQGGPAGGPYTNLSGATSNVLTITNATTNSVQDYQVIVSNSSGAATSSVATVSLPAGWQLAWSDEFNGTNLNSTNWTAYSGNDTGGNVTYTSSSNNVYVSGGYLHLVAVAQTNGASTNYTSGQVRTEFKFAQQYGLIVARMALPAGQGFWPAFWMLGTNYDYPTSTSLNWPYCGEIDVMENAGGLTNMVQGTLHYADVNGNDTFQTDQYYWPSANETTTNFHTYAVQWSSNSIIWQVDGVNVQTWTSWGAASGANAFPVPFNQPFFFLLDLAVSGAGDYGGPPNAGTPFPSQVLVDYVRVYEQLPAAPTGLVATPVNSQVSLSWSASSGATNYIIQRSTSNGGPYTTIGTTSSLNYVDTTAVVGTTYYYVVSAVNAVGTGGSSAQVSATPVIVLPSPPWQVFAIGEPTLVSIRWAPSPSGATNFVVERSATNGGPYTPIATTANQHYLDSNVTVGSTYYYVVASTNASGLGTNSMQVSATPTIPATVAHLPFEQWKYGMFVHYAYDPANIVPMSIYANGTPPSSVDDLANNFNVQGFADTLSSMGIQYIVFTAWHAHLSVLWPSTVMNGWLPGDDQAAPIDLLGQMITAVKAKGIHVLFYTHPLYAGNLSGAEQATLGFGPFNYDTWNTFIDQLYSELLAKYGSQIDGIYFDDGYGVGGAFQNATCVDYNALRSIVKNVNPNLVMLQNGTLDFRGIYTCDYGDVEDDGEVAPPNDWATPDSTAPGFPSARIFGPTWWSSAADGPGSVADYAPSSMFRFSVLMAGIANSAGGAQWAAGPYVGLTGDQWEPGILQTMQAVGSMVSNVAASINNTYGSSSYVTQPGVSIADLSLGGGWGGVATKATNDTMEYIHLLTPPAGNTLSLPAPADNKIFASAMLLANSNPVALVQNASGVKLTLQGTNTWSGLDTVIAMPVAGMGPFASTNPPVLSQPSSQTIYAGQGATLSVYAGSATALTYQWQVSNSSGGFTNIAGATNSTLTLSNIGTNSATAYRVIVSNSAGSVTSTPSILTVQSLPSITNQPTSQRAALGNTAAFSVGAYWPSTLSYQWQAGPAGGGGPYTNLVNNAQISGANSSVLNIANVGSNSALSYQVVVSNSYGSVTSIPVTLTVDPATRLINADFDSSAVQTGAAVLGASGNFWNAITGSTNALVDAASNTVNGAGFAISAQGFYTDSGGTAMDAATTPLMESYAFGYNSPSTVSFSITGLSEYSNSAFTLVVYAAGDTSAQGASLSLTGATAGNSTNTLTTTGASRSINAGLGVAYNTFTGVLTNGTLTVTASANGSSFTCVNGFQLLLTTNATPIITSQPTSQSTYNGLATSFSVGAAGSALSYQWQAGPIGGGGPYTNLVNGLQISGVNSSVLSITNITTNCDLSYRVIVSNSLGMVTSAPATLTSSSGTNSISIFNNSFESPAIGGPGNTAGCPSGWSTVGFGSYQAFTVYPGSERYPVTPPPGINGNQCAEIYSPYAGCYGYIYLDTGVKWQAGLTYKLTASFGGSWGELPYPNNPNFGFYDSSFNPIATQTVTPSNVPQNVFTDISVNYTATGNESQGQGLFGTPGDIIIVFYDPGSSSTTFWDFDNVRLTAVPPATTPPVITTQPGSQTIAYGSNALIGVAAASTAPLNYQWYFDTNTPVAGATNPTLSLTNVQTSGTYDVVVTSAYGSVTSSIASLTFGTSTPITLGNPSFELQSVPQGSYNNLGTGAPTDWKSTNVSGAVVALVDPGASDGRGYGSNSVGLNGSNYCQIFATQAGAVGTIYQDTGVKYVAGTTYTLTAAFGMENGNFATGSSMALYNSSLTPVAATTIMTNNLTLGAFDNVSLTYVGTGSEGGNGDIIVGFNVPSTAGASFFDFDNVILTAVVPGTPPSITTQPVAVTTNTGSSAAFTVVAGGTAPLSYQWYFDTNTAVAGATNATLSLTNVQTSGTYDVVVTSPYGAVTSRIVTLNVTPVITTQPSTQTVNAGSSASFSVVAGGTAPLGYQWYFDTNTAVSGGTNATLTLTNVQTSGTYDVVVSNASGAVTSSIASLDVTPSITTEPTTETTNDGGAVTFGVTAGGTGVTYQWYFDTNTAVSGGTNATLTLTNAQTSGTYDVVVTDAYGSVTSTIVSLNLSPGITTQPTSKSTNAGSTVTYSVVAGGTAPLGYQWYFDTNTAVSGGTNATLTLTNVQTSGTYDVKVTNAYGSVTSSIATLTVGTNTNTPIAIGNYSFELQSVAKGAYTNLGTGAPTNWSATNVSGAVVALVDPGTNDGRGYGSNPAGLNGSNYCQIFAYQAGGAGMIYQDTGVKYVAGTTYTLTAAFGMENGSFATGSTMALYNSSLTRVASTTITTNNLTLGAFNNVSLAYTGTGSEGGNGDIIVGFAMPSTTTSTAFFDFDNVTLTAAASGTSPSITTQPVAVATNAGSSASFSVVATGAAPLSYQWYFDTNTAIAGATNATLSLTNVQTNGTYDAVVSNSYGSTTSSIVGLKVGTLIDVDFGSGVTQSGAAVLGTNNDTWNAITGTSTSVVSSTGTTLSGVGLSLSDYGIYNDTGGNAMDSNTAALMEDYAFGYTAGTANVTISVTGLSAYNGYNVTLVVYAAGDASGQGASITLSGATGGNSGSALTTSATSRKISAGIGVAYQTFTGTVNSGTLTITATELSGQSFTVVNGFQLYLIHP